MLNEIRHFIPGDCATGPNKQVFAELDQGVQTPQLLALGQEACRSCLQLPDCQRQRELIAEELGNRNITRQTVVAAEMIEIPAPEVDKDTPRRDPSLTFNLKYPLTEPRHILEIIRQGLRSRQLSSKIGKSKQHEELSAHLEAKLRDNYELSTDEVTSWASTAAHLAIKYHRAAHSDPPADDPYAPFTRKEKRAFAAMQKTKLFREATAIQSVFVEDALTLRDVGFKRPETLARTHNPEFYHRLAQAYDSDPGASTGLMHQVLCDSDIDALPTRYPVRRSPIDNKPTRVKQAPETTPPPPPSPLPSPSTKRRQRTEEELRRQQGILDQFKPIFENRGIGMSYLRLNLDEAEIYHRLALYDEVIRTYPLGNMRSAIHYFCFLTDAPDPIAEIRAWKHVVANIDASYIHLLSKPIVAFLAIKKRGEELKYELDVRVQLLHELSAEYVRSPHPAVDDEVIQHIVQHPKTARKQLKSQEERWETVHAAPEIADIIAEMDPEIIRRILILHRRDPVTAIQRYQRLQNEYRYDDYVELSSIDNAIKWGLKQASISIRNHKRRLKKTDTHIRLDKATTYQQGGSSDSHEKFADSKTLSVEAQVTSSQIDPLAPTREESHLLKLFHGLPPAERAAVALVYDIPWLLSESMRDDGWEIVDNVYHAFDAQDMDELESAVEVIISKLRP